MATRGIVALLFTDLVGSTELIERLGDAEAESLRRTHFRLLRSAVKATEGQEVKNLGDGLMVVFPSAVAAVNCAVAMQRSVDAQNRERGGALQVRISLHVGEPIREGDDYFGTPVVVASRHCAVAEGGQIVASDLVRALAEPRSDAPFRPLGSLVLKGLAEPVVAWEVGWEALGGQRVPLPPALVGEDRTPFVGRQSEAKELAEHWQAAKAGHRRFVLLAGEPGIGKTRLASELACRAHDEGAVVLLGRCDEEAVVWYQPFVEAVHYYVTRSSPDELLAELGHHAAELARLVPEVAERLPGLAGAQRPEPEAERFRLFEAVTSLLFHASRRDPVLLVLDDLHWADKPTLQLLRHLVRSPEPGALLVLGAYRDTELRRSHPLAEALADLRRDDLLERVVLRGLSTDDVANLLARRAVHGPALEPTTLAETLHQQTEGNPFFIEEVIRHLVETGGLVHRDGRWSASPNLGRIGIPEGVKEVVGRRLSRLGEATNRALTVGAVIGQEFGLGVLEPVSDLPATELVDALEEAVAAGLVVEVPRTVGGFRFSHALVRETLYGELTSARKARLHRRVGEALEALHGHDPDSQLKQLAHHFCEAAPTGVVARAVAYAVQAGQRAMDNVAYEEAARIYERGLQVLELEERPDEEVRARLSLGLGEARRRTGDPRATAAFDAAIAAARSAGAARVLAEAAVWRSFADFQLGQANEASLAALEASLAALPAEDSPVRAQVLVRLGALLYFADRERCERLSGEGLAMARRVGDPFTLSFALSHRRRAIWGPDKIEERLALDTEQLQLALKRDQVEGMLNAHVARVSDLLELGRIDAVDAEIESYTKITTEFRVPLYVWWETSIRAMRALLDGRLEEAERLALESLEAGQQANAADAQVVYAAQTFGLLRERGALGQAVDAVAFFADHYASIPAWRCGLALAHAHVGNASEARRQLDRLAPGRFSTIPRDASWLSSVALLGEVCNLVGDAARAAVLHELLLPFADRFAVVGLANDCIGSVARYLGLMAETTGDDALAARHYEHALERNEAIGSRRWVAWTRHDYGRLLLRSPDPGDRARGRALNAEAEAVARELGMTALAGRAASLLARTPAR